jgi:hypothetical protein
LKSDDSNSNSKISNPKYSQRTPPSFNPQKVTVCSALRQISAGHGNGAKVRPIVETVSHEMPAEVKQLDPYEATSRMSFEEGGIKGPGDSRRSGTSPQMASGLISEKITNRTVAGLHQIVVWKRLQPTGQQRAPTGGVGTPEN